VSVILLLAVADPDSAAWARRLTDVMTSWHAQAVILLLWAGLGMLPVLHAEREWEHGLRNRCLQAGLLVAGVFFVLRFLLATASFGRASRPARPFVVEAALLSALWPYAFVRLMTRRHGGKGDDESRARCVARRAHPPGMTAEEGA
jgi:hypothetical protein